MSAKAKRFILTNIPYLFVFLLFSKLGEGWRLAAGANAGAKLLHLLDGLAAAFHSLAPTFHPQDLLIGLIGTAILRLAVYVKGRNARKFRKNVEYGSARWQEPQRVNLLVDIQAKLQAGKSAGYERWAKVFNLKQMAQAMNFLTENNLLEYAELEEKAATATARFNMLSAQIKTAETRMAEIGSLRTHIVNYSQTRDVYTAYRRAGYSKKFYEENASDILLHKAAKAAFDALPGKKIPIIKALQAEYETRLSEKKKAYSGYAAARKEMKELLTAKMNIDRLLGDAREQTEKNREQDR